MRYFRVIWTLLLVVGCMPRLSAADYTGSSDPRPAEGIYDPSGWITGPKRNLLARELASIKDSSGLDILVAVVEKLGSKEPQILADELANRWGYHGGRALILYVPENQGSPWISISGMIRSEMSPSTLEPIIERAKKRARIDPTAYGAVHRAVESLGDDLRFAAGRSARGIQDAGVKQKPPSIKDVVFWLFRSSKKILMVIGGALFACFLVLYAVIWIWRKVKMSLTPRTFPEVSWKRRFGAPHAGIVYTHSIKERMHRSHDL